MKPSLTNEKKSAKTLFKIILSVLDQPRIRSEVEKEVGISPSYFTKILEKRTDVLKRIPIPGLRYRSDPQQKIALKMDEYLDELLHINEFQESKEEILKIKDLIKKTFPLVKEGYNYPVVKEYILKDILSHPVEFLEDPLFFFLRVNPLRSIKAYDDFITEIVFNRMLSSSNWENAPLNDETKLKFHEELKDYIKSGRYKEENLSFTFEIPSMKKYYDNDSENE